MSEERRATPMAVENGGPEGSLESVTTRTPAVAGSVPPPRDASTARRRLALRIPDDEITRPQPAGEGAGRDGSLRSDPTALRPSVVPSLELPPPSELPPESVPLKPMRIITISEPPPPPPPALPPPAPPPPPPRAVLEDRTRPVPDGGALRAPARGNPPVEADEEVEVRFDDDMAVAGSTPPPASLSPGEPREARVAHRSDPPSDATEVAAEDVVTLEPPPVRAVAVLPPMRPQAPSQHPVPPPSRRALPLPPRPSLVIVPPHVGSVSQPSTDSVAQRRRPRLWWEDLFNDDYLRTTEKVDDDQIRREVAFIEESLGVERGGALLDLACGTGRHAIDLARRGYEVVGFDLSLAMLARAGDEAQDRGAKLTFVQGDMREMAFDEQFDGVYCWNTSFGYFEEDKNAQVVDRVRRALKVGGLFLLDVVNRDFLIRQSPSLAWFEADGCVCMDEMGVDFITSRMKVKRTMMLDDGRSREIEYSMRVYSLHELGKILHEHGFRVREVSGRLATPGVFFGNESPRAIILAEKR